MNWKIWQRNKETTQAAVRSFKAASSGTTFDLGSSFNINADLQGSLRTLRYRCRDMVQNNGYAAGIITNLKNNVVGPNGIQLNVQGKRANGQLDTPGNKAVEDRWAAFTQYGVCDVEGNKDFIKMQEMVLQAAAVDGESIIIIHRGPEFGPHQIQLEVVSADVIADYFTILPSGNLVYQGIEIDEFSRPQAYWLRKHDLNDPAQRILPNGGIAFTRVPASDVIHLYDVQHPKQMRGIPWLAASILNLHHVSQLQATEVQMARLAALKRVMFRVDKDENYVVTDELLDDLGNINRDLDSASIEVLQPGVEPVSIEWSKPSTNIADMSKLVLRQVAAGCNVSYNAIAKDLESVNYSSARFGALEDRVSHQAKQRWFSYAFVDRVYKAWLEVQLMHNAIRLPNGQTTFGIDRFDQFSSVKYTGRGWSSVDPLKDANANKLQLATLTTTFTEVCAQTGRDFQEMLNERVREEVLIKEAYEKAGLEPPALATLLYGVQPEPEAPENDGDETAPPPKSQKGINKQVPA